MFISLRWPLPTDPLLTFHPIHLIFVVPESERTSGQAAVFSGKGSSFICLDGQRGTGGVYRTNCIKKDSQ
jgi:hypothetical protein